jgi:hypothetical protein
MPNRAFFLSPGSAVVLSDFREISHDHSSVRFPGELSEAAAQSSGLPNTRGHLVVRFEKRAGMGHELTIGETVECLDSSNLPGHQWCMSCDVFDEFVLRLCRPGHEHSSSIRNCVRYVLKEIMVFCWMATPDAISLVMNVAHWIVRVDHKLIDLGDVEVKDASLKVVNPDDRVIVIGHNMRSFLGGSHSPTL